MNFELGDVASSSSSSSQSGNEDNDRGSNHEVDEALTYELRQALHLAVGKICRAEDNSNANADDDLSEAGNGSPSFVMSNEAIASLTDLTYHYTTSLLANDLVAFSKHAKRQTVKTDDVLLMARKDKKGMMAELKRVMTDNPDVYAEGSKKPRAKTARSRISGAAAAAAAAARKNTSTKSSGKSNNTPPNNRNKSHTKPKGRTSMQGILSSSSSSSSGNDSSGEDDAMQKRRKKLEKQRKNLSTGAFLSGTQVVGRTARVDNRTHLDSDTENDDKSSSSGDVEFEFGATVNSPKKNAGGSRKNSPQRRGRVKKSDCDLTDSDKSNLFGEKDENMVIDLASD